MFSGVAVIPSDQSSQFGAFSKNSDATALAPVNPLVDGRSGGIAAHPSKIHQMAIEGNVTELTRLVNENGANADEPDANGWTPLMYAVLGNRLQVVQFLMSKKVDMEAQNADGQTAFFLACRLNHVVVLRPLTFKTGCCGCCCQNWTANHLPDANGSTPLMQAVLTENIEVVKFVLEYAGNKKGAQDKDGNTALMFAVKKQNVVLVELIIDWFQDLRGAIDTKNKMGETALTLAQKTGSRQIQDILQSRHKRGCCGKIILKRIILMILFYFFVIVPGQLGWIIPQIARAMNPDDSPGDHRNKTMSLINKTDT